MLKTLLLATIEALAVTEPTAFAHYLAARQEAEPDPAAAPTRAEAGREMVSWVAQA